MPKPRARPVPPVLARRRVAPVAAKKDDGDVVDAEFTEVKDKKA
jgi:hypothetical protein